MFQDKIIKKENSELIENSLLFQFINGIYETSMIAVKCNGLALQFIQNQTSEICMTAVQQNGLALQFVHNKTPEICLAAVQQNGLALQYINN